MIENKIGKLIDTYYTLGNHDDISIAEEPCDILCYFILLFQFYLWREGSVNLSVFCLFSSILFITTSSSNLFIAI
jgi:uncharacterized protein with GYD domain